MITETTMFSPLPLVLLGVLFGASRAVATCRTKFSDAPYLTNFGLTASSETTKNKASDIFTVGWCAGPQNGSSNIDVDFKQPYGISAILVSGPTNRDGDPFPTNVLVKYVPNGGDVNKFVHFPLQEGKLEIKMTQPGTVQSNFGQGIAIRKLQFTIQSAQNEECLKIDLIGCTINDLCTGGCQNGGLCVMQDTCQCRQGTLGKNCELKACTPMDLGLADGRVGVDNIQVSSEDPDYSKAQMGNAGSKRGWCPLRNDHSPWVQITFDKPKAVSVFSFMWSGLGNQNIMTEFELQYIAPIDSARQFRTYATDIPAMNSTHIFTVTTDPLVVTDTIRIKPLRADGRACFKLEVKGCDPKALCSADWCQNGGTCMGENVCLCPSGFVGSRCEETTGQITVTNMTFVKIEHNVLLTTTTNLKFLLSGNVHLQMTANKPVVTINGTNSCISLNQTLGSPSCVTDVNLCTNGFTFTFDVNFGHLLDHTFIVSSGGHLPGHTGIALYYDNKQLHYIVSTSTQVWTLVVDYKPVLHRWQHFEITWNKHLGVELLVEGHTLSSSSRQSGQPETTKTAALSIGCSHTSINVNINMEVKDLNMWSIDRTELVDAGIKQPPGRITSPMQSTATFLPVTSSTTPSTITSTVKFDQVTTLSAASSAVPTFKFEDAINAKCTSYGWNISIDLGILKLLYPGIAPNDIYLGSDNCIGTAYNGKLWFNQSFDNCRTNEQVEEGTHAFKNALFYAIFDSVDPSRILQHFWTYNIVCYVSKSEATSSHLHHEVESHSKNVTAHHDIRLTFFKDMNFLQQLPGNPLRVTVGDNIYVKVSTSVPDWNTKMRLHTCYTITSDDTALENVLIRDGCEVDPNTHIISQSTHETKFVFRDFEYQTFNEGMDIYCNATFCDSGDYSPTCKQACRQSPPIVG